MDETKYREAELELRRTTAEAEHELNRRRLEVDAKRDARKAWTSLAKFVATTSIAAAGALGTFWFIDFDSHRQQLNAAKWDREQKVLDRYLNVGEANLVAGERLLGFMCAIARKERDPELKDWACEELDNFKAYGRTVGEARRKQANEQRAEIALTEAMTAKGMQAEQQRLSKATGDLAHAREELRVAKRELDAARQKVAVPEKPQTGPMTGKLRPATRSVFQGDYCIVASNDSVNYCFYNTLERCNDVLAQNQKQYPDTTKNDRCMARPVPLSCYLWKHVSGSVHQSCSVTRAACEQSRTFSASYSEATEVEAACANWSPDGA
jgi:hypothetical protein